MMCASSGNTSWLMCLENPPSPFSSELGNLPLQELSSVLMAMDGVKEPQNAAPMPPAEVPPPQGKPCLIQRSNTGEPFICMSEHLSNLHLVL